MDDDFTINEEFTSKLKRIKVPLVSTKDVIVNEEGKGPNVVAGNTSGAGGSDVPSSVEEERRHLVQATVVRVMKARKRMSHNDLVAEVTRQLTHRFQVSLPVSMDAFCSF